MKSQFKAAWIMGCLCAGLAAPAFAADTVVVEVTLDVGSIVSASDPGDFIGSAFTGFSPPFSVVLAEGDTLDLTIDFVGDQTLTIEGLDTIWALSFADLQTDVKGTGKFQFLKADGGVLIESVEKSTVEGSVHFGQIFYAEDFDNLPASITFSGVRYLGTVIDYADPGVGLRTYDAAGFAFDASGFTTAVPEPGSWALMLAGVGVLAVARRRHG